ncbi:sulfotransferase family 2 domain-containing protein (plasmid) [Amphritea atlantica]|uniref:Sulfotransferase family 2 domain-containing protein n=1 Tax=Amphritea atlantica TaxID=355243 RepID=A0ABY5H0I7_9GAMM|nr:sulfotransferase family 2 domain-containing protein [Amphritea atlantica]
MIVLDENKICFVSVPKNGTHTVYNHLERRSGRRVGKYHEFRWWKIPRYLFALKRYKTVMVWRDPVDRAVSLYKDIVLREHQEKRKVVSRESQEIHHKIAEMCDSFSEFVDYLCEDDESVSNYLFKSQEWWVKKTSPDLIIKIENLNSYLYELTGEYPSIEHQSIDLDTSSIVITDKDRFGILNKWAKNDFFKSL